MIVRVSFAFETGDHLVEANEDPNKEKRKFTPTFIVT